MSEKITHEYIKKYMEGYNYKLTSTEYKGQVDSLEVMCNHNHEYITSWKRFKKGQRCPLCARIKRRKSYSDIKTYVENDGFILLSDNYINKDEKLSIRCNKGHVFNMSFRDFKRGNRCSFCNGNEAKKHTYEYVKQFFENENYKLLSKSYVNKREKLTFECPMGHIGEVTFGNFKSGTRCKTCSRKSMMHSYKFVRDYISNMGNKTVTTNLNKTIQICIEV